MVETEKCTSPLSFIVMRLVYSCACGASVVTGVWSLASDSLSHGLPSADPGVVAGVPNPQSTCELSP